MPAATSPAPRLAVELARARDRPVADDGQPSGRSRLIPSFRTCPPCCRICSPRDQLGGSEGGEDFTAAGSPPTAGTRTPLWIAARAVGA